mgnify:CR=1 FL=1
MYIEHYTDIKGSSPRVRGAGVLGGAIRRREGIIPARAGSRHSPTRRPCHAWDHPRACGEQAVCSSAVGRVSGSSPRVRGAATFLKYVKECDGIIPARAGSRGAFAAACKLDRDHPRACGEQFLKIVEPNGSMGSSPRVRGAVYSGLVVSSLLGIIPARAGSNRHI